MDMGIVSIIIVSIALLFLIMSVCYYRGEGDNSKKPIIYGIICAILTIIGVIIYISWMRGLNI